MAACIAACAKGSTIDPPDPTGSGGASSTTSAGGADGGAGGEGGALGALGTECTEANACDSGFCVDGVCCRTACDGICATCDVAGECVGHPADTDPEGECQGATCDGAKACAFGAHRWSYGFGDLVEEEAGDVAVGPNGEVVMVGTFIGDIDFGGGPISATVGQDIYVAKLDAMGNHVWSKGFGNVNMNPSGFLSSQLVYGVTIAPNGHIFLTGTVAQDISFGGPTLTAQGLDLFIVELDENGDHVRSRLFYATSQNLTQRIGYDVAIDASGNILLTGRFSGTLDFDGNVLDNGVGNFRSTFVAKLDPSFTTLWASSHGTAEATDEGRAIVPSVNNEVVICGLMAGNMTFGAINLTTTGPEDAFAARFDTNGNVLWAKRFGGVGADMCNGMTALNGGDVAITGYFEGTVSFGGDDLVSLGSKDAYLVRLTGAGTEVWSQALRGPGDDRATRVVRGPQDTVIVTGSFAQTLSTGADFLTSQGAGDVFLARLLETTGAPLWARRMGGVNDDVAPEGLAVDASTGEIVISGTLGAEMSFGGAPIQNSGVTDVYAARFGP